MRKKLKILIWQVGFDCYSSFVLRNMHDYGKRRITKNPSLFGGLLMIQPFQYSLESYVQVPSACIFNEGPIGSDQID